MEATLPTETKPIVFFDGYCNLCSNTVQFLIKRDKKKTFLFAPLSGSTAARVLGSRETRITIPDSFILVENGNLFFESTAALRVFSRLPWFKWMKALLIFPEWMRNPVYRLIARYRYKWFGKRNSCWLPKPDLQERFLD